MKYCDILVVEDDSLLLKFYYDAFDIFLPVCSFKIASSGEEALFLLNDCIFKVALIDIGLPGKITGIDLSLFLKEKNPDTILYAVTGLPNIFDNFKPEIAGFNTIFNKADGYKDIFKAIINDLDIDIKIIKN